MSVRPPCSHVCQQAAPDVALSGKLAVHGFTSQPSNTVPRATSQRASATAPAPPRRLGHLRKPQQWIPTTALDSYPSMPLAAPAAAAALSPAASTPLPQLVLAAAAPVAKLALFCAAGAWAARRGLLPPEGRRLLSSLTLHLFTPCLLFSKLAAGGEGWAEL
ncbi:hypothetical protein Agub_g4066, partial [Astrephomene gubernaculifera]